MTNLTVVGYEIINKVGEGAMSEVFSARNNGADEIVAIKVLRQYFKDNQSYISRLKQEGQTLSLVSDDRIVRFIDITKTSDGRMSMVFEFVDGKNLEQLLQSNCTSLNPLVASCIISEVLLGLEETHRHGIIHRDLKPENIMLTAMGRIKITDFGVAKNLESQEMTVTGIIVGSPAYMSPEQARGEMVDARSDLYSLGILLYKISTGNLPFIGNNYQAMVSAIMQGTFTSPEKIRPDIHPELVRIIKKALSKDINGRYQKAYQFRYDLMKFLDHIAAPSVTKVLERFFANQLDPALYDSENVMRTIIERANEAFQANDKISSIKLIQQAINLAPGNQEAKVLLAKFSNKTRIHLYIWAGIFLAILLGAGATITFETPKQVLATKPFVIPIPIPTPTIVDKHKPPLLTLAKKAEVVQEKAKEQKEEKSKEKITVPTRVVFKVPLEVKVYFDGVQVMNPEHGVENVSPGKHEITLIKPGLVPIISNIDIISENKIVKSF